MTDPEFAFIRDLIRDRCALVLEPGKQYLVESRLGPIIRQHQLGGIADLIARLRAQPYNGLQTQVVEAMVTTETSFFRDVTPFDALRKTVLPDLLAKRAAERKLSIWCAASSSGQEPYSLALLLRESFPELKVWSFEYVASDLSQEMLRRSKEGLYSQLEVNRGLPAALLLRYFSQEGTNWRIAADVRAMIDFREINLARGWPLIGPLDLVMMRNVLIYFDAVTKKEILARVARLLAPGGYLLLGGAETTFNLDESFRRVEGIKASFYQLVK